MTRSERRALRLERLFWQLRSKYLKASAEQLTFGDIMNDIASLKKYHGLDIQEKAELCERAVRATDGHGSAEWLLEDTAEEYGSLAGYFA